MILKIHENILYHLDTKKKFAEAIDSSCRFCDVDDATEYKIINAFKNIDDDIISGIVECLYNETNPVVSTEAAISKSPMFTFEDLTIYININGTIYSYDIIENKFHKQKFSNTSYTRHIIDDYDMEVSDEYWISLLSAMKTTLVGKYSDTAEAYQYGAELLMLIFMVALLKNNRIITYDTIRETEYLMSIILD